MDVQTTTYTVEEFERLITLPENSDLAAKAVEVYVPDQAPQTKMIDDILDGGTMLPGFSLPVRAVFEV